MTCFHNKSLKRLGLERPSFNIIKYIHDKLTAILFLKGKILKQTHCIKNEKSLSTIPPFQYSAGSTSWNNTASKLKGYKEEKKSNSPI